MRYDFVLGANDPEMAMIARLLEANGLTYWFAAVDGKRCHLGNATRANGLISPAGEAQALVPDYSRYYFVESRPESISRAEKHRLLNVIDHHEEGDPGYALGPNRFWEASSLGQVVAVLTTLGYSVMVTQEMKILAAMDHCRQAAIRGGCPGVTAKEVIACRVREIAQAQGVTTGVVEREIKSFSSILRNRRAILFADGEVVDFTDTHLGVGCSLSLLCVQTALNITGIAALLRHNDTASPATEKVTLSGHASERMVEYFMNVYGPHVELKGIYGVPARSYAGGYLA